MGTDISHLQKLYSTPNPDNFADELIVRLKREWGLKYGENMHQRGAIYSVESINEVNTNRIAELTDIDSVRSDGKGKGGLSGTNMMDITRAMDVLKYFENRVACVIMKHTIVSGFAMHGSLPQTFVIARDCDARSNYGGTAVFTRPVDKDTAEALFTGPFVDVLAAPDYEEGVIGFLESKSKNMRIAKFSKLETLPKFQGDNPKGLLSIKEMPTGRFLVQDIYLTRIRTAEDLIMDPMIVDDKGIHCVDLAASYQQVEDAITAWHINLAGARSNGVVAVRDGVLVSCGSGQVERVGAIEQMIVKGIQKAMDREGIKYDPLNGIIGYERLKDNQFERASVSSDGFFPFNDSPKLLGRMGVKAVIQPFGSRRDAEVIDELLEQKMAGFCTQERGFGHF